MAGDGKIDYAEVEKPTVIRQGGANLEGSAGLGLDSPRKDMDYLDIPAFLRRQAD